MIKTPLPDGFYWAKLYDRNSWTVVEVRNGYVWKIAWDGAVKAEDVRFGPPTLPPPDDYQPIPASLWPPKT